MRIDNLTRVFRMVVEGRIHGAHGHAWVCPRCATPVAPSHRADERDRLALSHCLLSHSMPLVTPLQSRALDPGL